MITIRKQFDELNIDEATAAGLPEDSLLFDIETTGLSPYESGLYLIGILFLNGNGWETVQWFAESFSEEQAVLRAFLEFSEPFGTLVSFNGDGFDLRFLEECANEYRIPFRLKEKSSIDLHKIARKLKHVTGLTSCRQKDVEEYLGVFRPDPFSGAELIRVYERYVDSKSQKDLDALLLHNENDVEGLTKLLPLLPMLRFLEAPVLERVDQSETSDGRIVFTAALPVRFPKPIQRTFPCGNALSIRENHLALSVPVFSGPMKLFFPDWRNYSFLPNEGIAVHNKLAAFVDSSRKTPATRETAYSLLSSEFVPASGKEVEVPLYRREYADPERFIRLRDLVPERYATGMLSSLLTAK
jgi:uncharacterized protein YprB with RNaseH-like and TPR domain